MADDVTIAKPNRIPQIYGYTVCLIAVVAFLISINQVVDAAFSLANPLHSRFGGPESFSSFEAYEATRGERVTVPERNPAQRIDTASVETRRRQYEALRADRVDANRYRALRDLVSSGLILMLSIALFAWHWNWLRARAAEERAATARTA
ncbi:MAG TPA: hypothetical protein VFB46_10285 [Gemmatimonadaceae bacterium]|nr:hypothetical protein [Gemmatimonadaceae bacterium]